MVKTWRQGMLAFFWSKSGVLGTRKHNMYHAISKSVAQFFWALLLALS
jgi:hypothetical protein